MNTTHAQWKNEVKGMRLTVAINGQSYLVCSEPQMAAILEMGRRQVSLDAQDKGENLVPEDLDKRTEAWRLSCGYATIDWLLARMTPDEKERWKMSYRFSGIFRPLN